jgi:hypothetical protein
MAFGRMNRSWRRRGRRQSYGGYGGYRSPGVVVVRDGGSNRFRRRFNVRRTAAYRSLSAKLRSTRRRASHAVLRVGRYKFTMAGLAGIAAIGGLGYWVYNHHKETGKWL